MVSGVTKTGFEFSINEEILNDWRLAKAVAKTESKKDTERLAGTVEMVEFVLGDQEDALCNHVKREDGIMPVESLLQELSDIMDIAKEQNAAAKN